MIRNFLWGKNGAEWCWIEKQLISTPTVPGIKGLKSSSKKVHYKWHMSMSQVSQRNKGWAKESWKWSGNCASNCNWPLVLTCGEIFFSQYVIFMIQNYTDSSSHILNTCILDNCNDILFYWKETAKNDKMIWVSMCFMSYLASPAQQYWMCHLWTASRHRRLLATTLWAIISSSWMTAYKS